MLIAKKLALSIAISLSTFSINAQSITVEENRVIKADKVIPAITFALSERVELFTEQVEKARNLTVLSQLSIRHGKGIWNDAKQFFNNTGAYDDRPLYWSRLKMSSAIKQTKAYKDSLPDQQNKLLWQFELYSRGQTDIKFDKNTHKKILVVGFDPTRVDRNIKQSNPSGSIALALDDLVISNEHQSAEIETLILPFRFADFDGGIVEELLTPYFSTKAVDMVLTMSMGRNIFELERFAGLRRSDNDHDNENILSGADKDKLMIPQLRGKSLKGPEFLEFTLPVNEMKKAGGFFPVIDNRIITTKNKTIELLALAEVVNDISVQGSGGGHLDNEVSYRSLLLRDLYSPVLPVGHIHTPSIKGYDEKKLGLIVSQLKAILTRAVKTL